jgi:hypothetical protein
MDLHVLAKHPLAAVVMNIVSFGLQFAEKIESGFKWMALLISITVGILTIIAKLQEIKLNRKKINNYE